jgi:hypothetical protein
MRNFSNKFLSLLESMKSSNMMMEDAAGSTGEKTGLRGDRTSTGRSQKRSDRREARLEDKFLDGDKFVVRSFIKAIELLQGQILATRIDVSNTIKNKFAGAKYGDASLRAADTLLSLVLNIKRSAEKMAQSEGSRLELDANAADIKFYQDEYTKYEKEYEELKTQWADAQRKEQQEQPILAANQKIEKSLNVAKGFFKQAQDEFTASFSQFVPKKTEVKQDQQGGGGEQLEAGGDLGATLVEKPKPFVYKGKDGEIVMEVKKLIYNKFKKYKSVSSSYDWGVVYKNWPEVSATLRENTAKVIKAIKAGLAKDHKDLASDKTGSITPKFLEILRGIKEGLSHNTNKIVSFESFMKNRINEDFDEEAAGSVLSSGSSGSSGSGKKSSSSSSSSSSPSSQSGKKQAEANIPAYPATPFKTDEEGNKFREWVNKTYPDWAKKNNLDASGAKDNSYIRKAYAEYGKDYKPKSDAPKINIMDNKQLSALNDKIKAAGGKTKLEFTTDTKNPVILFYAGKEYGHVYINYRVDYVTSSGSKFLGTYDPKTNNVKFDNGKTFDLTKWVTTCKVGNKLAPSEVSTSQGKKVYMKPSNNEVNVRSSAEANTGSVNNLIYTHKDKSKPIGILLSSTLTKSSKIGDWTWYKVQFPSSITSVGGGVSGHPYGKKFESGWVRSDTVDVK